ncbi:hypothetical protein AB0280_00810 [Pseudarthrobacter sp902506025]|uniref:Repeat protein (TIGR01451 family) n=1 Tax=Pseudarthrobacter defluvii TaxID=410837 RepID=A0ABT9UJ06_9MICC|nr:hypothetical protein [Pseudarthrobacter defluvii]MDQ0118409.1 hypothetical protein [Pseudarthrobacter defluvii]
MQNESGAVRAAVRRTTTSVRVLLVGLLITFASAGTIFAASQGGSQGNKAGVTIQVNPASRTVNQGDSVSYTVSLTSANGFNGSVTPTVSGLPAGTTAAFAPSSVTLTSGKSASVALTVATQATTALGKADLTIATAANASQTTGVLVQLIVQAATKTFTISGNLDPPLTPGASMPLNLSFINPNNKALALSSLSVSITSITRTKAAVAAGLPCSTADYVVTNYSGQYPLTVPVGTSKLEALRPVRGEWPRIAMLDTTQNQDGCKGATLQLSYTGAGEGN